MQTSVAVNPSPAPYPDRASLRTFTVPWAGRLVPGLRKFLRTQQILLSIGALICLILWALRIPTPLVLVLVNTVFIGNVLSAVMDYACPLYDGLSPPWNWVVYVPLLASVSALGILLAVGSLY